MTDEPLPPDLEVTDNWSATGLKVTTEMPYRLLLVSDFAGSPDARVSGALTEGVTAVNANSFDELLAEARPSVRLKTTDPTRPGNVMVEIDLAVGSMRDLDPVALASQAAPVKTLFAIREKLLAGVKGTMSVAQVRDAVAAASAGDPELGWLAQAVTGAAAPPAPAAADVLSQLDLGDGDAAPPPKSPLGNIIASAAAQGAGGPDVAKIRAALTELDKRLNLWINKIAHAPAVQALESAWRGLQFLITHMEFRKGLRLSVLHAPRAQLIERFTKQLIDPIFDDGAEAPDVILIDHAFSNSATDVAIVDELAQHAASLPAVISVGLSPAFLGVKQMRQIMTLPTILSLLDQWQFAKWKTMRNQGYARHLGVVLGRGLLRTAEPRQGGTELDFAFVEDCASENDMVWAGGAIAMGCTIAQSVANTGWPLAMSGHMHGQVEGFKQITDVGPKKDREYGPADLELPQSRIDELTVSGINVLMCSRGSPTAVLSGGLSVGRPSSPTDGGVLEISLPYQLFAARVSSLLLALQTTVSKMGSEQGVDYIRKHVCDWLGYTPDVPADQLNVQIRPSDADPSIRQLAVSLVPPPTILPGGIPLVLGYALR